MPALGMGQTPFECKLLVVIRVRIRFRPLGPEGRRKFWANAHRTVFRFPGAVAAHALRVIRLRTPPRFFLLGPPPLWWRPKV